MTEYWPKWIAETSYMDQLAIKYHTDKSSLAHGYTEYYEKHLYYLKQIADSTILEIGILTGASIRMWHDYFTLSKIIGIDLSPPVNQIPREQLIENGGRIQIVIQNINNYIAVEPVDVVIDDGSHKAEDIVKAFNKLWPTVKPDGWYIIEDWNTQSPNTRAKQFGPFGNVAMSKHILEDWATEIALDDQFEPPMVFTGTYKELHVYPEITFLRKR